MTGEATRKPRHEHYISSMPGSWPEVYPSPKPSPPPSYQKVERHPVPQYHEQRTRYLEEPPTTAYKTQKASYNIPTTQAIPVPSRSRHLRSGSDILVVHHPTPREVYG